jgi:hypothetical protein
VCGSGENCKFEETSNHIFCSACLQSAHTAQEWWGTDLDTAEAFEVEGAILHEDTTLIRQGVFDTLIANGSLLKQAKRGKGIVSMVQELLELRFDVGEKIPDGDTNTTGSVIPDECPGSDVKNLKDKIRIMKMVDGDKRSKEANTIERYAQLRKRGSLGTGQAGTINWEWANTEAPKITADPCNIRPSFSVLPLDDGCAPTMDVSADVVTTQATSKKRSCTKQTQEGDECTECMDAWVQCATCLTEVATLTT